MNSKRKIALIFGGKSAEHEISLQSAYNIFRAIDKNRYDILFIGIDKKGRWFYVDERDFLHYVKKPSTQFLSYRGQQVFVFPGEGSLSFGVLSKQDSLGKIDVIFPVLHGPFGEDGTIQGLFKMLDIPFVGADVTGSALAMDKEMTKRLLREAGIPTACFKVLRNGEKISYSDVAQELGPAFFVKPANLGSSVGIHLVHDEQEYNAALSDAFSYDHKVLIEERITGREIECSVLGNNDPVASLPGEIIASHEFYDYQAKYIDKKGASFKIPAGLSENQIKTIQKMAVDAYKTILCKGMARVDFFVRENGEILINELNTIPGFTKISMYPKMWEASGISYQDLISRLIDLAFENYKRDHNLKTNFSDD